MYNNVEKLISQHLDEIEVEKDIEIIFAVENGSRAWGFESNDSDYDIRFVFKKPLADYLELGKQKKETLDKMVEKQDFVFDYVGWDIRKFLFLLSKSNPTSLEWLESPILYYGSRELFHPVEEFIHLKSLFYHYSSLAKTNYERFIKKMEGEVRLKKYFYILRGILNTFYVIKYSSLPPMNFEKTVNILSSKNPDFLNEDTVKQIKIFLQKKREGEDVRIDKSIILENFIENWFNLKLELGEGIKRTKQEVSFQRLNDILREILHLR